MSGAKENAIIALEEQAPVINFSLGKGEWIIERAHKYGSKVITTVVHEKHARSAASIGVDVLLATGHEEAVHGDDVTSLCLITTSKIPDLPIICAGGIGDGCGLAAMLSVGADAAEMGSRLVATIESPLAQNVKEVVVKGNEGDTIYGRNFDGSMHEQAY